MAAADPLLVYGTDCSYFTGKLETYLRAKGIAYRLVPFSPSNMARAAAATGVQQVPLVEQADGSWLADTTLIIAHFERQHAELSIRPTDPAAAFVSLLIEDYADEWLWRPAMHFRWSYPATARLMSAWLSEHLAERAAPGFVKRLYWRTRQFGTFVRGDGVTAQTRTAVESAYLDALSALEAIFARRPFLLGARPSEADFGFMGPMFRHFFSDPAPARIMRARAPGVQEWVARMWNLDPARVARMPAVTALPDDLGALLAPVVRDYLPYLDATAAAYARGERRVRYAAAGASFDEPVKPYRVWCRDRLHAAFLALDQASQRAVTDALGPAGARVSQPSPRPAPDVLPRLPILVRAAQRPADSWWR